MTSNQISYWNYLELVRSNRAREAETMRSNQAKETETARANRAQEAIAYDRYLEEVRANKANESIKWAQQSEVQRANRVAEQQREAQVTLWNQQARVAGESYNTQLAKTSSEWATYNLTEANARKSWIESDYWGDYMQAKTVNTWADTVSKGSKVLSDLTNLGLKLAVGLGG